MPDQFQYIKLPDGSYGKFAANASDEQIRAAIQKDFPNAFPAPEPTLTDRAISTAKDFAKGVGEGLVNTISGADDFASKHLPAFFTTPIGQKPTAENSARATAYAKELARPTNTTQSIGKGLEQAAEFLIPGAAEERLLGGAGPITRAAGSALTSGAVNKLQGGDFKTGAVSGASGSLIGSGLKAVAPKIAESAIGIRRTDRAYKAKNAIGRALLDETKGYTPEAVGESAQKVLDRLNPELENAVDRASVKSAPKVKGYLEAPAKEIPLGEAPTPGAMPGGIYDAQPFPVQNVGEARVIRRPNGQILPKSERIVEFPDETGKLPVARDYGGKFLSRTPTRKAWMAGTGEELLPSPEFSGPGVVFRREPIPVGHGSPEFEPNRIANLGPAKSVIGNAIGTATRQGERNTISQLNPVLEHLTTDIAGNPIPNTVTPRQLLDLKRGLGNEFVHTWNPETLKNVSGTAASAYHELGQELNRVVPEARSLNSRIASLIPVEKRASGAALNASTTQKLVHKVGAPTGALLGGIYGGEEGYKHGGIGGAVAGGLGGLVLPTLVTTPTGQIALARALNSAGTRKAIQGITGLGMQLNRPANNAENQ